MPEHLLRPSPDAAPIRVAVERDAADASVLNVTFDGRAHRVEVHSNNHGDAWLELAGRVVPFAALEEKDHLKVWVAGRTHTFELPRPAARRAAGAATTGPVQTRLTAPMPGTILKIRVARGDAFEPHAALVIMESMKMEMTLSAAHPGKVAEVLCKEGQLVEMGAALLRFEGSAA